MDKVKAIIMEFLHKHSNCREAEVHTAPDGVVRTDAQTRVYHQVELNILYVEMQS